MRPVEAMVFLSLATGLHLGAWTLSPRAPGASADGGPGEARVTLAAATPQQAALTRAWRTAPVAEIAPPQPVPTTVPATMPPRPRATADGPALSPVPALPAVLPVALPRTEPAPTNPVPMPTPAIPTQPQPPDPATRADAPSAPRSAPRPDRTPPTMTAPVAGRLPMADDAPPPAPKPARPPASAAAPAAAASGGGRSDLRQVGRGGADQTQAASAGTRDRLQAKWGAKIQRRVHRHLIYPRGTRENGTAKVALTINRSGRLTALHLVRSSGAAVLDRAALNAVRRSKRFPPAPEGLMRDSYSFTLSLAFRR